jgi:hypothetical protein
MMLREPRTWRLFRTIRSDYCEIDNLLKLSMTGWPGQVLTS